MVALVSCTAPPWEVTDNVDEQVQAHVAQTEVDPGAAVGWLRVTDAGMEASPTATQLIRSILQTDCPGLLPASLAYHSIGVEGTYASTCDGACKRIVRSCSTVLMYIDTTTGCCVLPDQQTAHPVASWWHCSTRLCW